MKLIVGPGVMKSATTWLYEVLIRSAEVSPNPYKEMNLLNELEQIGGSSLQRRVEAIKEGSDPWALYWREQLRTFSHLHGDLFNVETDSRGADIVELASIFAHSQHDLDIYRRLFEVDRSRYICDITPEYGVLDAQTVERFSAKYGSCRVVLLFRDPTSRIVSHMSMYGVAADFLFSGLGGESEVERLKALLMQEDLVRHSAYALMLSNWSSYIAPARMLILYHEEILASEDSAVAELSDFLDLSVPLDQVGFVNRSDASRGLSAVHPRLVDEIRSWLNANKSMILGDHPQLRRYRQSF